MPSQKSGIIDLIVGAAAVASAFIPGVGPAISAALLSMGSGMILSGAGTLIAGEHDKGYETVTRNPITPWRVQMGHGRVGGALVYMNQWGDNAKMLDLVIVLASHPCQGGPLRRSLPVLLFDQQRVQIDTSACWPAGTVGGTSFTPVQQDVVIADIQREGSVVTVRLDTDIPYLTEGDSFQIHDVPHGTGDVGLTLNGRFQVSQIIGRVPSIGTNTLTFTFLSAGPAVHIINAGHVKTLWADYGRKVYMEALLGDQVVGQTFAGMLYGTPHDGDMGRLVGPESAGRLGGGAESTVNPWTAYHSLAGKTAVFLRLHYNDVTFQAGLPQISFVLWGRTISTIRAPIVAATPRMRRWRSRISWRTRLGAMARPTETRRRSRWPNWRPRPKSATRQ